MLARGEDGTTPPKALLPSGGEGSEGGQRGGQMPKKGEVVHPKAASETKANCPTPCPSLNASAELGSTPNETNPKQPHARAHEERTPEEMTKLKQQAWDAWG